MGHTKEVRLMSSRMNAWTSKAVHYSMHMAILNGRVEAA